MSIEYGDLGKGAQADCLFPSKVPDKNTDKREPVNWEARFHDSYIPEPNSGCWLWEGSCNKNGDGYGYCYFGTDVGVKAAHRFSWEVHNGAIPDGLHVCHHCDTPSCVNPNHLFLGTAKDNHQDRKRKRLLRLYKAGEIPITALDENP